MDRITSLSYRSRQRGFTIVELLIVVVVIAILAAITIMSYNGITQQARASQLKSLVSQTSKKIQLYAVENADSYPATLSELGITGDTETTYQFVSDNTVSPRTFCLTVTIGETSYYNSEDGSVTEGICRDNSILVWNKLVPATSPVPTATLDNSEYRVTPPSLRLTSTQHPISQPLISVTAGDTYRVSAWVKTTADWNGTSGNSKIRFGDQNGALLTACPFSGPKAVWTFVTCTRTASGASTSFKITVGDDGSVGTVWLDDLVVSKLN